MVAHIVDLESGRVAPGVSFLSGSVRSRAAAIVVNSSNTKMQIDLNGLKFLRGRRNFQLGLRHGR